MGMEKTHERPGYRTVEDVSDRKEGGVNRKTNHSISDSPCSGCDPRI